MIPSSSISSGSNLDTPRIRRSIESLRSLPRATEAPLAIFPSFSISTLVIPLALACATVFIASAAEIPNPVIA